MLWQTRLDGVISFRVADRAPNTLEEMTYLAPFTLHLFNIPFTIPNPYRVCAFYLLPFTSLTFPLNRAHLSAA